MKATDIVQPTPMTSAIAANGSKDSIPQQQSSALDTYYCSVEKGFPDVTMQPMDEGGFPPRGQGANGLFYIASDQKVYLQNGGSITFDQDVSDAIGGYPQGAVLDYIDGGNFNKVISLIDDNTYNFVNDPTYINGTYWQKLSFSGDDFLNKQQISNCILEAPNGAYELNNRTYTVKEGLKVLIADGRNTDNTLKNIEYTVSADVSADYSSFSVGTRRIVFLTSTGTLSNISPSNFLGYYKYQSRMPSTLDSTAYYFAFAEFENLWYSTNGSTTANWQPISVIPIGAVYMNGATTMNAYNVYWKPIKLVDTNMADGQWIYSSQTLNTSKAYNTYDIDLSNVIPRDQFDYECIFRFMISRTDDNNGNSYYIATIGGSSVVRGMLDGGTSSTDNKECNGQFIGIIDGNRSMSITLSASSGVPALQGQGTYLIAYRRLGANG